MTHMKLAHSLKNTVALIVAVCVITYAQCSINSTQAMITRLQLFMTGASSMKHKYNSTLDLLDNTVQRLAMDLKQLRQSRQGANTSDPTITTMLQNALIFSNHSAAAGDSYHHSHSRAWMQLLKARLSECQTKVVHPIYRRVVALLLLRRSLIEPVTSSLMQAFQQILLQLYHHHTQSASMRSIMEYFHISKTGGTSLCHAAERMDCKTMDFSNRHTCLVRGFDDGPRWVPLSHHRKRCSNMKVETCMNKTWGAYVRYGVMRKSGYAHSCEGRQRILQERAWNFYANEYTLHGGQKSPRDVHVCPQFFNVVLLREPKARLLSHVKFLISSYYLKFNQTVATFFEDTTASMWKRIMPAAVDNYYIRSLLGEALYHMHARVTTQHLAKACFMLSTFDVILVLEHEQKSTELAFKKGMGWHHTLHSGELARSSNDFLARDLINSLVPTDMEVLYMLNTLDAELYQHAAILSMLDQMVWGFAGDVLLAPSDVTSTLHQGSSMLEKQQAHVYHKPERTLVADQKAAKEETNKKKAVINTNMQAIESLVRNPVPPGFHRSCGFFVMNSSNKPHVMSWAKSVNSSVGNLTISNVTTMASEGLDMDTSAL